MEYDVDLDHFDEYDAFRTLKCVSLVCRNWSRISRSMIHRVGVWKPMDENGHQELLNQMPKINTLLEDLTIKGAVNMHLIIRIDSNDHDLTCAEVPEPLPREELAWFFDN
ncbi:hypothetical protein BGZ59_004131 [Podila verticillata]|nr:hypothetical protein BGZ59_004131 [Podila verticillata]